MSTNDIDMLRRRMEEAAILPSDDPQRQKLVFEIAGAGGPLEREWLDLLKSDERLRLELARVPVPAGLEERLLAIPANATRPSFWSMHRVRWLTGIAAVIALLAGLIVGAQRYQHSRAMSRLAALFVTSHESRPELAVVSADWNTVAAQLKDAVPFIIDRPTLEPNLRLIGAATTTLDGNKVFYTRWTSGGRTYSLYQFCASDFGLLQGELRRQTFRSQFSRPGAVCKAVIWSERYCDYALVYDDENQTSPAPDRI
jgi:hypothetical protein